MSKMALERFDRPDTNLVMPKAPTHVVVVEDTRGSIAERKAKEAKAAKEAESTPYFVKADTCFSKLIQGSPTFPSFLLLFLIVVCCGRLPVINSSL